MTFRSENELSSQDKASWIDPRDLTEPPLSWRNLVMLSNPSISFLVWPEEPLPVVKGIRNTLVHCNVLLVDPNSASVVQDSFLIPARNEPLSASLFSCCATTFSWIYGQKAQARSDLSANATTQKEQPEEVRQKLQSLIGRAKDEVFEDGIETEFSKQLLSFIRRHKDNAIQVLGEFIFSEHADAETVSEALRWFGHIEDPSTHESRLWLLGRSLRSFSPRVRDAAALGLASLGDPEAIPFLEAAIKAENLKELREDMEEILLELKSVKSCHSS